ncbi:MAG: hypothetical protein ACKVI3_06720 [Verrucomicrobiia bacterium]|tara:strand:- start:12439 stop:12705 length:267 start_codon:yes stop_codon:yes gene_type:complete
MTTSSVNFLDAPDPDADENDFDISRFNAFVYCVKCGNEMAHDGNSLALAESPRGAQFECGRCEDISQWAFTWHPFTARQVPAQWGGTL